MNEEAKENKEQKPSDEPPLVAGEIFLKEQEIASLKMALKQCEEKNLRLLAESENSRKRLLKEREDLLSFAVDRVIVEFLQPLDNFEKALSHAENASAEVRNWAMGFEMILAQFKQVLIAHGICDYESVGAHFDPHLHEAVEVVETKEHEKGKILSEFSKGYKKGDRIIRPAKVKVAKTPLEKSDETKEKE